MSIEFVQGKVKEAERELARFQLKLKDKEKEIETLKKEIEKWEGKKAESLAEVTKMQAQLTKITSQK